MADTSDVQDALAALVASILYPPGAMGAGAWSVAGGWASGGLAWADRLAAGTSAAGVPVRIYRGWPVAQQLDPDLAAGIAHVSIYEDPGRNRLTGGYLDRRIPVPGPPPTIQALISGQVVTLSGEATPGNMVGLLQAGQSASYVVQPGDTLLSVAQALAAQFGSGTVMLESGATVTDDAGNPLLVADSVVAAANGSGATITFSNPAPITARVASQGSVIRRGRQQTQGYRLICWAPTPTVRDAICRLVDAELADTHWLQLPDQRGRLLWAGTRSDDVPSKAATWRRDLTFLVTFWTTRERPAPPMLFGQLGLSGSVGATLTTTS